MTGMFVFLFTRLCFVGVTERRNLFQSITDALSITLSEDPTASVYLVDYNLLSYQIKMSLRPTYRADNIT